MDTAEMDANSKANEQEKGENSIESRSPKWRAMHRYLIEDNVDSQHLLFGSSAIRRASCEKSLRLLPWQVRPRHRRAFKSFCSQKCADHYEAWLRAEVGKRKRWSDI
jgi:hypothetical protein